MTFMQRNECHYSAQKSRLEETKMFDLLRGQTSFLVYKMRDFSHVSWILLCVKSLMLSWGVGSGNPTF